METRSLPELLEALGGESRTDYTLDRLKSALREAGDPHRTVHPLIIAGTNGKGSTTLYVSAALKEAGFKVGTYLSPHLCGVEERFLIGCTPIDSATLDGLAQQAWPLAQAHRLTGFEFLTLIFFLWARAEAFDFMVLEVGLGGRLDATNVVDALGCAVTSISLDHQEYLGTTPEAILGEKLGVLRPEGLLFSGLRDPKLKAQAEAACAAVDAVYYHADEIRREVVSRSWGGQHVRFNGYPFFLQSPASAAVDNAALAFLMVRILFPKVGVAPLQRGFARVKNPGRLDVVASEPRVVLSGDHNPAGLAATLADLKHLPTGRLFTLAAFAPDKPYREMYGMLRERADTLLLTRVKCRTGYPPAEYEQMGPFEPDPERALDQLVAAAGPEDSVLVTGSLYLVGRLLPRYRSEVTFFDAGWPTPVLGDSLGGRLLV